MRKATATLGMNLKLPRKRMLVIRWCADSRWGRWPHGVSLGRIIAILAYR
jgi:hypothetical protein